MKICYQDNKACNIKQGIWCFRKKNKISEYTEMEDFMLKVEHPEKTGLVGADFVENVEYNKHAKSC